MLFERSGDFKQFLTKENMNQNGDSSPFSRSQYKQNRERERVPEPQDKITIL